MTVHSGSQEAGPLGRVLTLSATAGMAAGAAMTVRAWHRAGRFPGGNVRWERTNHAGQVVTLTEGPAFTLGAWAPLVIVDGPAALTAWGAGSVGALDDLRGGTQAKGLRGHLRAFRQGQLTTGVIKIVGLATTGLVAVAWHDRRSRRHTRPDGFQPAGPVMAAVDSLAGAALVAGAANLANLFDLRPGRALKVALTLAAPMALAGRPAAAATLGAGIVVLPDDLAGRSMLGDTGANPLGALVGLAAAQQLGRRGRMLALVGVSALTLASERVSFTRVIESTPVLRHLDRWGRPR